MNMNDIESNTIDSNSHSKSLSHSNINIDVIDSDDLDMDFNIQPTDDMLFTKKIHDDLENIRKQFKIPQQSVSFYNDLSMVILHSNSPVMSIHSDSDSDSDSYGRSYVNSHGDNDVEDKILSNYFTDSPSTTCMKVGFRDVERSLHKYYESDNLYSSELDILTTYMKGQKNIYIQSKYLCQRKLNCLMFPSLFFSAFITIIAPFIECSQWSTAVISGMNAIVALFISLINYLKLEAAVEIYLQVANHYDNLQTMLELTHSKLMFLKNESDKSKMVLQKFGEVENKMTEMKLSNNILIPEEIKLLFPIICHINIFSFIKKSEIYKKDLIRKLCDITNEIQYILFKWKTSPLSMEVTNEKTRLLYLYENKKKLKAELINFQSTYSVLDDIFTKEIKYAEENQNHWQFCFFFGCFNNMKKQKYREILQDASPIILKYYKNVFDDT